MTAFLWAWQVAHLMLSEWDKNVIVCSRYPAKPHWILKEKNFHISSDQSTGPEFQDTKSHVHSSSVPSLETILMKLNQ